MFRGEQLKNFKENGSLLIPHELLRYETRYEADAKCNNEIRGGGTTNKEAPLWAPSGKNLTTPEKYLELVNMIKPDIVQVTANFVSTVGTLNEAFLPFCSKGMPYLESWLYFSVT